jgi:hypothetical protein
MYSRGWFGCEGGHALSDVSMNGVSLVQNCRGLAMETQDMDFAIDAFRDRDNRLVECAAGKGKFFADAS